LSRIYAIDNYKTWKWHRLLNTPVDEYVFQYLTAIILILLTHTQFSVKNDSGGEDVDQIGKRERGIEIVAAIGCIVVYLKTLFFFLGNGGNIAPNTKDLRIPSFYDKNVQPSVFLGALIISGIVYFTSIKKIINNNGIWKVFGTEIPQSVYWFIIFSIFAAIASYDKKEDVEKITWKLDPETSTITLTLIDNGKPLDFGKIEDDFIEALANTENWALKHVDNPRTIDNPDGVLVTLEDIILFDGTIQILYDLDPPESIHNIMIDKFPFDNGYQIGNKIQSRLVKLRGVNFSSSVRTVPTKIGELSIQQQYEVLKYADHDDIQTLRKMDIIKRKSTGESVWHMYWNNTGNPVDDQEEPVDFVLDSEKWEYDTDKPPINPVADYTPIDDPEGAFTTSDEGDSWEPVWRRRNLESVPINSKNFNLKRWRNLDIEKYDDTVRSYTYKIVI